MGEIEAGRRAGGGRELMRGEEIEGRRGGDEEVSPPRYGRAGNEKWSMKVKTDGCILHRAR